MGHQTPLYQNHVDASAKMVDFAGWDMPINYGSQLEEHEIVRGDAGVFDVSHMNVVDMVGADARNFLRYLLANDVDRLTVEGKALYSCMLNPQGGIIDDLIVYYLRDQHYRVVVNSATREKDLAWMEAQSKAFNELTLTWREDIAMVAVQGPKAIAKTIPLLADDQRETVLGLSRFQAADFEHSFIARTGYTGEDGFEIMMSAEAITDFWCRLLDAGVTPCGLGARDTLRLESGMHLYGTDMDDTTSPLISGLNWTVAMHDEREFVGRAALQAQQDAGVSQQFVGLVLLDKGVLRNHLKVVTTLGEGEITSGSYSPTLKRSIAMARVPVGATGRVEVEVRNRMLQAEIVKLPFVRNGKSMLGNL